MKTNRYDITSFFWRLNARLASELNVDMKLSMSRLRHLYPSTNWTTTVSFMSKSEAEQHREALISALLSRGWTKNSMNAACYSTKLEERTVYCIIDQIAGLEYDITPLL